MGFLSTKWLVLWSLWAGRLVRQPTVTLQLSNGLVRGSISPDGSYAQYSSIPYATLEGKFQAPGPEPTWEGTFDAINENIRCLQSVGDIRVIGTPHCHILNVYTPLNTTPESKLPVMVFIHGGGYFQGSGSSLYYGPVYLVTKGVILVTVNYRLNIQGFLCLGIKEAPGNAAMKDQAAAFRWVQRNIRKFGGDPDNVTIFGESAGAASISFHLYSPMSKGLFQKAITQSGSSLAPWAFQFRPVFLASLLAKVMLYESQDPYELYKYFMTKSDEELILTRVPRKAGNVIISEILYTPCAEEIIDGVEPFLTESPFNILSKGNYNKVPMIIGINNEEGLLITAMENKTTIPKVTFQNSLPKNLEVTAEKDRLEVANELERLYMEGREITEESVLNISTWTGESNLIFPSLAETESLLKTNENPIYNYLFQYFGRRNIAKMLLPSQFKEAPGATHADELFYLFSQNLIAIFFENEMVDRMTTMWTNFAKYGDPTPDFVNSPVKWHRTNSTSPTCLVIDSDFDTRPLWYNDRLKYLREVYSKFRRKR